MLSTDAPGRCTSDPGMSGFREHPDTAREGGSGRARSGSQHPVWEDPDLVRESGYTIGNATPGMPGYVVGRDNLWGL